ncbi:hypothetical protein [Streptomyces paromomycinus]|uniref:Tetratricopeptide repeat protein n=1 Tax=Streptomyces paromomycinus TaxID=92743 RepID=A0A401WEA8_STREY|nr:hypothetical protein [Streptomyces paromomycinus]GCD47621.1 hypothetical protein GKJPGBOP_07413 [Streptomyces paromomycinus]
MDDQRARAGGDVVLTRIGQAVMLHRGGDREEARNRLARLWAEIGPDGDPFHRCTLAHYLADTQDDPADELDWDLTALETARQAKAARAAGRDGERQAPSGRSVPAVAALLPSLHLSLAADYAAMDRPGEARAELDRARRTAAPLADDEYGRGVRQAIERLGARIAGSGEDGGGGEADGRGGAGAGDTGDTGGPRGAGGTDDAGGGGGQSP